LSSDNFDFASLYLVSVRGAYGIICELQDDTRIKVGSLGSKEFVRGVYVYVGSAQRGIEQRVGRHRSRNKKRRWHIDYFLDKAEVNAVVAVPSEDKETECRLAKALLAIEGARVPVRGFGSSDCGCEAHLVYLGDEDVESVSETVVYHLSMLGCMYPEKIEDSRGQQRKRR